MEFDTVTQEPEEKKENNFAIPVAIVIAGGLVALAIYARPQALPTSDTGTAQVAGVQDTASAMRPIGENDHILGNPAAPVKIVEYSDTECPFCKRFHTTMQQVMSEYGADGRVAWVYRHLPLDIHPKARKQAEATECVAKLGGNQAFWKYLDTIFELTPANNGFDNSLLPQLAEDVGVERRAFESCLNSGEFASYITDSINDSRNAGANGTPFSLVVAKNGTTYPISGALPYATVREVIELALEQEN